MSNCSHNQAFAAERKKRAPAEKQRSAKGFILSNELQEKSSAISDQTLINLRRTSTIIVLGSITAIFATLVFAFYLDHLWMGIGITGLILIINIWAQVRIVGSTISRTECPKCGNRVGSFHDSRQGFVLNCVGCGEKTQTGCGYQYLGGPVIRF
jgi:hypothetical protein